VRVNTKARSAIAIETSSRTRLQRVDATKVRRDTDRATNVGADAEGAALLSEQCRLAAAAATWHSRRIPWIGRDAVYRITAFVAHHQLASRLIVR